MYRSSLAPSPRRRLLCAALAAAPFVGARASESPLKIVVGFPPGGGLDVMGRVVAQALGTSLGRPVVVDNQPGAGSLLAAQNTARARADGNTLLLAPVVVPAFFPALYKKLNFDPLNDLLPVAELGAFNFALAVGPQVDAKDLPSFIRYVQANPGKVAYGSLSAGTPSHFLGTLFNQAAKTDMLHVPYKGAAPVFTALQSGEIQAAFVVAGSAVELHKAGRVRVLGVTGQTRSAMLPDVPTLSASVPALSNMDEASLWYGFFAPKGTDAALIERHNAVINAALRTPEVKSVLTQQDVHPSYAKASAFAEQVQRDSRNWGAVIRSTGFTLEA